MVALRDRYQVLNENDMAKLFIRYVSCDLNRDMNDTAKVHDLGHGITLDSNECITLLKELID